MNKNRKKGDDLLEVGSYQFSSRLMVGTGKYKDIDEARQAIQRVEPKSLP